MPPPRRTAPKIAAPQTLEAAIALIAEYRDLGDKVEELNLETSAAIARIEAERDTFTKPLEVRAALIFEQLRAWWAVAAPELTQNKRKSIALAGCNIGERTSPPALKLRKVKVADLIAKMLAKKMTGYLRITHKLDKPNAIKAIQSGNKDGLALGELGAVVVQGEEFFIDWPKPKPADLTPEPPLESATN